MSPQNHRILIVDDDRGFLANLSDILADEGYQTEPATSEEDPIELVSQACAAAGRSAYDLCLLEFNMPGMGEGNCFNGFRFSIRIDALS